MDAAKKYADGILDQKLQRDKAVTLIEDELDGVLGPNLSDEDYLASASLDRETMRTLVVRIMPTCTGPANQEVAVAFSISGPDGIEMETEQEQAPSTSRPSEPCSSPVSGRSTQRRRLRLKP